MKTVPTVVILALPGVSGLNAAEHLRSLYPKCGIIWCSDLDFSLHAFRLRIEYFYETCGRAKIKGLGLSFGFNHYTITKQKQLMKIKKRKLILILKRLIFIVATSGKIKKNVIWRRKREKKNTERKNNRDNRRTPQKDTYTEGY